jgi:predicted amidohydrolase YtcJ
MIRSKYFTAVAFVTAAVLVPVVSIPVNAQSRNVENECAAVDSIILVNARILTMDAEFSEADSVRITGGRIEEVGDIGAEDVPCTEMIDVGGRTVIPGLIDSHIHLVRQGNMPGYPVLEGENTNSISELQSLIGSRASNIPEGEWVAVLGGIDPDQFDGVGRLPNLVELDDATTDRPVFLQIGFAGPGVTNSPGKGILENAGVIVGADGSVGAGKESAAAFALLRGAQLETDRERGIKEIMMYANSLGLTTVHDEGGVDFPGAGFFDPERDYDTVVNLWRRGETTIRIRAHFGSADTEVGSGRVDSRLNYAWSGLGDGMLRATALGEHIVTFPRDGKVSEIYADKVRLIAERGWAHEQHSVSEDENLQHFAGIVDAHTAHDISELRWSMAHVFELGHPDSKFDLGALAEMGMGLKLQSQAYVLPTDRFPLGRSLGGDNAGPLYRTLYDRGDIPLGAGTDGILVVPLNPWFSLYYMTTGRDNTGKLINPGQTLTRLEALRLYTTGSAWFANDENQLGSIEKGKLADIVVLSDDYLEVDDEELKQMRALLTIVDGKIVYRSPGLN